MTKKIIYIYTTLFLFLSYSSGYAETYKYRVDGFSKQYYGYIKTDSDGGGIISIRNTKSNTNLITMKSESINIDLHDGEVKANILSATYGEQSIIMYEDYNFDGINDFALSDGNNSCYGGPSFQIYLAKGGKFKHSRGFTRLAQEYCGMFTINPAKKVINTMTKSGCCWHQYSTFIVKNNAPKAIKVIEESYTGSYILEITTKRWKGNKLTTTVTRKANLEDEDIKQLFSFSLLKNKNKKMTLISSDAGEKLNYLFTNKGNIKLNYPSTNSDNENQRFTYKKGAKYKEVSFSRKDAQYTVYQERKGKQISRVGIIVIIGGKRYDLQGDIRTVKGRLGNVRGVMKNVLVK